MNNFPFRIYIILSAAWRRRYSIMMPVLLFPLLGFFVGSMSPKHYKSHTSMLIQETAKMNPFLEDFAVSSMLKERTSALKTLLNSRHILHLVASKMNMIDEKSLPEERDWVIGDLSRRLDMQFIGKDLIRINLKADRPEGMKELLTIVSEEFVEQLLAPERSSIKDSSTFLKQHLATQREALETAEKALANFKVEYADMLPELHVMNISRLNQLKQQLSERQAEYSGVLKNVNGIDQLLSTTNPIIGRLEEQIVRIQGDVVVLRSRYTDKHSKIQAALRSLRRLEVERKKLISESKTVNVEQLWDRVSANLSYEINGSQPIFISQLENLQIAKNKAESLQEEITHLQQMVDDIEQGIHRFGQHQNLLLQLQRDLKVKQDLYTDLLERYEMAQITGSLGQFEQEKRVKIIDKPFTPSAPANFPLIVYIVIGLLGGCTLGIGFALILESADTVIRYKRSLENMSGVPVISRVPLIKHINE